MNKGDQVVVKESIRRSGPVTKHIQVGKVLAMSDDTVTVSLPRPGGRFEKREFPIKDVEPVSEVFRRNSVQINPVFRQIYKGSV